MTEITDEKWELFLHVRKTFLFFKEDVWVKKNNSNFDVPMGSYDSAEVCELVALYLLHLLKQANLGVECGAQRQLKMSKRRFVKFLEIKD